MIVAMVGTKLATLAAALLVLGTEVAGLPLSQPAVDLNVDAASAFTQFKAVFGKSYSNQADEKKRFQAFSSNFDAIKKHNKAYDNGIVTFYLGVNQYTDLTNAEYKKQLLGYRPASKPANATVITLPSASATAGQQLDGIPASIDWRQKNAVTPVKNQAQCGSCWSFAVTGAFEGQHAIHTGQLVSLSEQQLIDCSRSFGLSGCEGGNNEQGITYAIENGGIDTESSYPYKGKDGTCAFDKNNVGATARVVAVVHPDEGTMQYAVATYGPIAVGIDAGHPSFQNYAGGVYYEPACVPGQRDHAPLVVGYGSSNGQDYWIVKNSWGTGWGEQGYIRMARNRNNNCDIAADPSFPMV